jgi:hypothetical protein
VAIKLIAEAMLAGIAIWIATNYIVFSAISADPGAGAFVRWLAGAF